MATVASDTSFNVDDDAFILHCQRLSWTDVNALSALNTGIFKKYWCFSISFDFPSNIAAEEEGDDKSMDEPGFLMDGNPLIILYDQLIGLQERILDYISS